MAKKKKYIKKQFESNGSNSDVSSNIYESMVLSVAWSELTPKQKELYLICKLQMYAQNTKEKESFIKMYNIKSLDSSTCFTMNKHKATEKYAIYKTANIGYLYRDITALISKGFIRCIASGFDAKNPSLYQYSDKWQVYGTDKFELLPSEMNQTLLKQYKAKS